MANRTTGRTGASRKIRDSGFRPTTRAPERSHDAPDLRAVELAQIEDFISRRNVTRCPPSNDPDLPEPYWDRATRRLTRRKE